MTREQMIDAAVRRTMDEYPNGCRLVVQQPSFRIYDDGYSEYLIFHTTRAHFRTLSRLTTPP